MFDLYRFLNRFHTAMAVHTSTSGHATNAEVGRWEQEFEMLKPAIIQNNTDITHVLSLTGLLEIQSFYFCATPQAPPHVQQLNYLRAFNTARTLISTVLEQESRSKFLTHATNQLFRSLVDAACIVTSILYSTSAPADMSPNDANLLAQHAAAVLHRCSVEESDLPHRIGVIVETFWAVRHLIPRIEMGPRAWSERLGVGMSFWCLELFKRAIGTAQKNSETAAAANRADALIRKQLPRSQPETTHETDRRHADGHRKRQDDAPNSAAAANGTSQGTTMAQASASIGTSGVMQPVTIGADPFQEIDWSMFTDDFGWVGDEGVLTSMI